MVGLSVEEVLVVELPGRPLEEGRGIGLARETGCCGRRLEGASYELWIHLEVEETEVVVDKRATAGYFYLPRALLPLLQRPAPITVPRRPCVQAQSRDLNSVTRNFPVWHVLRTKMFTLTPGLVRATITHRAHTNHFLMHIFRHTIGHAALP